MGVSLTGVPAQAVGENQYDGNYTSTSVATDVLCGGRVISPLQQSNQVLRFTVKNGVLAGDVTGKIDRSGNGTFTMSSGTGTTMGPFTGPGYITPLSALTKRFTATLSRPYTCPPDGTQRMYITADSEIPAVLANYRPIVGTVKRGVTYPKIFSFCQPEPRPGYICGGDPTIPVTNPVGGPATNIAGGTTTFYYFATRGFLPRNLVLNFKNGLLHGKALATVRPGKYPFEVCPYTSMENRYSACRPTSIIVR